MSLYFSRILINLENLWNIKFRISAFAEIQYGIKLYYPTVLYQRIIHRSEKMEKGQAMYVETAPSSSAGRETGCADD